MTVEQQNESGSPKAENSGKLVFQEACRRVGEVIVLGAALDALMNTFVVAVCHLDRSAFLEPVLATVDFSRKVAIAKARAKLMSSPSWRKAILDFTNRAEKVSSVRNIAAHSLLSNSPEGMVLRPMGAYKLLSGLDLQKRSVKHTRVADLISHIEVAEKLFAEGQHLIDQLYLLKETKERKCPE